MTLANTQQEIFDYLTQSEVPECRMCPEDQFEIKIPARQLTAEEVKEIRRKMGVAT